METQKGVWIYTSTADGNPEEKPIFVNYIDGETKKEEVVERLNNGLRLGVVAELEAQTFNMSLPFFRSTTIQFATAPAITQNRCWLLCFF